MDNNEQTLIRSYLKGDQQSLELLIKQYLKPVYGFIYRYVGNVAEAEDLTQEVFLRMWKNLKKFDQKRSFRTWLFAIAKNAAFDYLKKKKAIPLSNFENAAGDNYLADSISDPAPLPSEIFEKANLREILEQALIKLPDKYQVVLHLYYHEQFNLREISEILGDSLDTVKSRQRRALFKLRENLSDIL